jgi:hypothetical protein
LRVQMTNSLDHRRPWLRSSSFKVCVQTYEPCLKLVCEGKKGWALASLTNGSRDLRPPPKNGTDYPNVTIPLSESLRRQPAGPAAIQQCGHRGHPRHRRFAALLSMVALALIYRASRLNRYDDLLAVVTQKRISSEPGHRGPYKATIGAKQKNRVMDNVRVLIGVW